MSNNVLWVTQPNAPATTTIPSYTSNPQTQRSLVWVPGYTNTWKCYNDCQKTTIVLTHHHVIVIIYLIVRLIPMELVGLKDILRGGIVGLLQIWWGLQKLYI